MIIWTVISFSVLHVYTTIKKLEISNQDVKMWKKGGRKAHDETKSHFTLSCVSDRENTKKGGHAPNT